MSSSVLQNKIPYPILYPNMDMFPLPPKIFGSLCFIHNHSPNKTKLDFKSLSEIFLGYSRTQKDFKCFCPSIGRYILSVDVTFESTPEISTSSAVESDDDYNYLIYKETLINSGKSTSENVSGKDPPQFWDSLQTYTRRITPSPVPSPASVQVLHKSLVRMSPLHYRVLLLLMIFPLHFEKENILVLSILSPILSFILIYRLHFVHSFQLWTHTQFSRMYQKHYLFQVEIKRCWRR